MTSPIVLATSRRRFLQYLAGSPLFASGAISAYGMEAPSELPDPMIWAPAGGELIKSPKDAINVFDFEPVAHKNVPPAHFGFMASGIDDEVTLRANREGFSKFQLLPRRLSDVSKVDTSVKLFGAKFDSPIFVCPTAATRPFTPTARLLSPRPRAPAIICKSCRRLRTIPWKTSPMRAGRQSGSSFTPRRAGRLRRR